MATRMQQRRGTAAQWATANPVLADGEIGWEKDTGIVKMGNGSSTWNTLPPILNNQFLAVGGKAYDSERLDGLDSTAFVKHTEAVTAANASIVPRRDAAGELLIPAGASLANGAPRRDQVVVHYGTVTTFPTGIKTGDRCYRSDLFCEFYYTGAAWRQTERATMTSAQRAALSTASKADLYIGFTYFESDTLFDRRWDGTYWEIEPWHGNRAGVTGSGSTGLTVEPAMALSWTNAAIGNNSPTDFAAWSNIYTPTSVYANAGDGPGGPALFTYVTAAGTSIRCNAKGRVKAEAFTYSDGNVGVTYMALKATASDGLLNQISDRRYRGTGFAGAGLLDQTLSIEKYVMPGDIFGLQMIQFTNPASTTTYPNTILQVAYI